MLTHSSRWSHALGNAVVPSRWQATVGADVLDRAESAALDALATDSPRPAQRRLANFYDRSRDFAGASFVNLAPVDPNDIAAVDLHATSLLSVQIGPGVTRRLLEPSSTRARLLV